MNNNHPKSIASIPSSSVAPPISAAIICFNEERMIGKCIEALQWCDEIVVVDSGSTDRTTEIVKSLPKTRLLYRSFDTFKEQKNFALDACVNDWVLSLDADEFMPAELRSEIQHARFDVAGYQLRRINFLANRRIRFGNWNPDYALRLIRKSQCRWGGTNPHESVSTREKVQKLRSPLMHYSYAAREDYIQRNREYALMMVQHLREQGRSSTRRAAYVHGIGNFLKAFVLRRGFLDGADGWFLAWHGAKTSFFKHAELAKQG